MWICIFQCRPFKWQRRFYTHRHFYTHFLRTEAFTHKNFTQRSLCTQELLHTEPFTHRSFYTQMLLHTDAFTHRCVYTLTHRTFYTQKLFHREAFTHRNLYAQWLLQRSLLHRDAEAFTHRRIYTEKLLHREVFYTEKPFHRATLGYTHTQKPSRTEVLHRKLLHKKLLHCTDSFLHKAFTQRSLDTEDLCDIAELQFHLSFADWPSLMRKGCV